MHGHDVHRFKYNEIFTIHKEQLNQEKADTVSLGECHSEGKIR